MQAKKTISIIIENHTPHVKEAEILNFKNATILNVDNANSGIGIDAGAAGYTYSELCAEYIGKPFEIEKLDFASNNKAQAFIPVSKKINDKKIPGKVDTTPYFWNEEELIRPKDINPAEDSLILKVLPNTIVILLVTIK